MNAKPASNTPTELYKPCVQTVYIILIVADDLRSINCDVTSISGMTKSCFFNLVDTLD